MQKTKNLLAGILAVILVLAMQTAVFAEESSGAGDADLSSATDVSPAATSGEESSTAEEQSLAALAGESSNAPDAPIVGSGADDDNPDTGIDDTMLKVSGALLVLAVAGIVITTRRSKRSQG